jgi:hypothetical protein
VGIFHLTVKRGSRSENRLSVAKHDYIMRLGRFSRRHDGELAHAESGNMPIWAASNPRLFWELSDVKERANGTLYHEVEFALPIELTQEQQIEAARELTRLVCGDQHPYSWGFHDKAGNPHVHLMFSGRMLDGISRDAEQFFKRYNAKSPERGGCRKESSGNARGPEWVSQVRKAWQEVANRRLADGGHTTRIDHRSNKARGIQEVPGIHLGRRSHRQELRGKSSWRGVRNRERQYLNASLREVQSRIHQKEISHGRRYGRPGKPYSQQQHRAGGAANAPQRAFAAWIDRGPDRPGLRVGRHLGPQRMPALCDARPGHGQQEPSNTVLQRSVPGHRDRDYGVHGVSAGGSLYTVETLDRRQLYKARLLQEQYQQEIHKALAARLAYVDRQPDHIAITLKGGGRVVDHGDRLLTKFGHDQEILAAIALAKAKGWKAIDMTGTEDFKRRAWLEASRAGLQVTGYLPSPTLQAEFESQTSQKARSWPEALRLAAEDLAKARPVLGARSLYEVDTNLKQVKVWLEKAGTGIDDDFLWEVGHHEVNRGKTADSAIKAIFAPLYQLRRDEIDARKRAAEAMRNEEPASQEDLHHAPRPR